MNMHVYCYKSYCFLLYTERVRTFNKASCYHMTLEANYVIHKYLLNHLRTELAYVDDRFNHLHGNMIGVYYIFFMCMIFYKICTRLCFFVYLYFYRQRLFIIMLHLPIYISQGCLISIGKIALAWFPECQWSNPERYVWHWASSTGGFGT